MSNELQSVLDDIKLDKQTNLKPENIKKDITVLGVTGTLEDLDTGDATATANDIINPKTAYVNGEKITGLILPSHGDTTLVTSSDTLTTNISARSQDQIIQDINYKAGIAIRLETNSLRIYRIIDGTMNTEDSILITIPNKTFGSGVVKFVPRVIEDGYAHIIICACNAGNPATYFASMYKINLTDYTLSKELASLSSVMSISRSTEAPGSFAKWQEALHFTGDKFVCAITESSGIGYGDKGWRLHYVICSFTNNSITKVTSSSKQFVAVSRGDDWDGSYPKYISSYISGNYLVYKAIKNYRGGTQNNLYYATLILNLSTYVVTSRIESSNIGYDVVNGKLYGNNKVIDLATSVELGSCQYIATQDKPSLVVDNFIISYSNNLMNVYNVSDMTVTKQLTIAGTRILDCVDDNIFVGTTSFKCLVKDAELTGFTRQGVNFYNTNMANATSDDIVFGKIAYNSEGKITGTMPNNGKLNYAPSTEEQTIPAGYTSGGTVRAVNNQDKEITENGTYTAGEGYTGLGTVTVNVPQGSLDYNAKLVPVNGSIKNYITEISAQLDTSSVTDMLYMFEGCTNLTTIPLLDTSSVTDMSYMFYGCTSLTEIPLLNTSKVESMFSTFRCCTNLTTIPLLDTSSVINLRDAFDGCNSLTAIPELDTSSLTNMYGTFDGCNSLIEIPLLNTSKVDSMQYTFRACTNLTTIPLLDTSSVTDMSYMFANCTSLATVPELDTSNVIIMSSMFTKCTNLTTIPLLNTSKVTNMQSMFTNCTNLTTIPLLNTSKVTNMQNMVGGCGSLSDESLNNILAMCVNATSYTSAKTLKWIGLSSEQATKCQSLSNYSAFTSAGWTTGY